MSTNEFLNQITSYYEQAQLGALSCEDARAKIDELKRNIGSLEEGENGYCEDLLMHLKDGIPKEDNSTTRIVSPVRFSFNPIHQHIVPLETKNGLVHHVRINMNGFSLVCKTHRWFRLNYNYQWRWESRKRRYDQRKRGKALLEVVAGSFTLYNDEGEEISSFNTANYLSTTLVKGTEEIQELLEVFQAKTLPQLQGVCQRSGTSSLDQPNVSRGHIRHIRSQVRFEGFFFPEGKEMADYHALATKHHVKDRVLYHQIKTQHKLKEYYEDSEQLHAQFYQQEDKSIINHFGKNGNRWHQTEDARIRGKRLNGQFLTINTPYLKVVAPHPENQRITVMLPSFWSYAANDYKAGTQKIEGFGRWHSFSIEKPK